MGKELAQKKDGLTPPFPNRNNTLFYLSKPWANALPTFPRIGASTLAIPCTIGITYCAYPFLRLLIIDKLNNLLVGLYIACIDV